MTRKRFALHMLVLAGLLLGTLGPMLVVPASVRAADPCSVRVMPLGDSITDGTAGSSDDTGYRRSLYLQLTAAGYTVDFVGSLTGGIPTDFDRDHEGHGGWQADQIRDNVYGWLDSNPADVVLLHIGTNDISGDEGAAGIRDEIEDALDNIDQWETDNSADVWVVLARIINRSDPSSAKGQETTALNGLLQTLADSRIAAGDQLIVVDMESALTYPGDLADTVHPNDTGYGKMADVWYDALSDFLPAWCSSDPAVFGLSLDGETPDVNATEDLTCRYRLNDAATTAGTAWTKDGSPHMALYMPMEGGETNGLLDYSGSGHNGSKGTGVTWSATADRDGHGAFSFDHTGNAWIDVGSAMPVGAYSKVAWVKIPDHSDCNNIISGDYSNALWVTSGRLQAGHNAGWTNHVRDTVDFPENVWTFVAVTFDPAVASGQMILYRDGNPVASNNSVPTHSCTGCADPNQLWVGAFSNSPSGEGPVCTWNGEIDDARVYDYALSPEQIAALYGAGTGDANTIVSEETQVGEEWQCQVTPFDDTQEGTTTSSNTITIQEELACPPDMNAYYKLDEASSPYADLLGGPDATCINCPAQTTGIVGSAQHFDGSDDEVDVPDNNQYDWGADDTFSIEFWMKDSNPAHQVIVGRQGETHPNPHWWVGTWDDGKAAFCLYSGTGECLTGDTLVGDGSWRHIVALKDATHIRLYVDGQEEDALAQSYSTGFASTTPLNIGYLNLGDHYRYEGDLDEVALYDRALSPTEIQQHYNNGLAGLGYCGAGPSGPQIENLSLSSTSGDDLTTDDLICSYDLAGSATTAATAWYKDASPQMTLYMPMEGGATNALLDHSGSGNHGSSGGNPAWHSSGSYDGHGYFDFDGDDYIDAGNPMPAAGAYSKVAWVYWIPGNYMNNILSGDSGHAFWATEYPEDDGHVHLSGGHGDPWREVKDPDDFPDNAWTFVALTYDPDSTTMVLYKNGVEVDRSTTCPPTDGDTRLFVGSFRSSGPYFKGYIDDARIYNQALSPEQVAALYNAGAGDANIVVSQETDVGDEWQCRVTPFDDTQEGTTSSSNSVTIQPSTGTGDITIEKVTNPAGGTGFDFAGDLGPFTLDDGASQPFTDQAVGDYDVTETPPSGWLLADVACAGGDYDPVADGVTIHLDPGEDIICTFVNEEIVVPTCPGEMISYHKLDEASAPYADYLGGPDANCTNCPTAATGLVNGAQQFDGADDEVDVPDDNQYDWAADDSFTIEYWMQKSTSCTGNEVIVGRDDGSTALHWWTGCQGDGTVRFQLRDVNGNGLYLGGTGDPINDGEWHHLVFVRDEADDENRIYIDGVETHQDTYDYTAGFGSSVPLNVGYLNLSGHYRYDGLLDEVALYDRALTDAEILQHYNAGVAGLAYCERPPEAPTITSSPVTQAYVGVPYSYDVQATGYPAPTYALTVAPADMTIDELTGEVGWTPTATGDYDVVVEAHNSEGFDQQSFVLSVSETPPFALRINCGGSTVVDGDITWESSAPYVTGGADYTFSTSSVDTTTNGIEEPVPPLEVYKACRHQSPHTYSFPSVPNGDYIVRIHWIDQVTSAGLREIDYDIEGVRVEEDWDVYAEAGGTFVAIDKEYEVMVSDGDGLQITSSADSGDAFESAIEITSREDEAPTITSDPVTQAYVGVPYSYDVEASGYPVPTYTLTVAPAGMTIDETTGEIAWTPTTAGDYDVTVQASNGVTPDATQSFTINVAAVTPCPLDMSTYWRLDEASSGSYEDSFSDNDGVCRVTGNCPVPAASGKVNGAQEFSRASQLGIDIPVPGGGQDAPFDWGPDDSFSIEFWMKRDGPINGIEITDNEVIIGRDDPGTQLHWWFGMWYDGVAHFQLGDKTGDSVAVDGPTIDDGRWHHLVGVRDAGNGINYLYVDGIQYSTPKPSYSGGFDSPTAALNLGWLNLNPGYYYTGLLDEVALYDRALTEKEVQTHYYLVRGYCAACESSVRIMPLGDSITVGNASGAVPDDEAHWVSYRKDLWESLGTAGYDVDFVGGLSDGYAFDPPFDSDHEGHGGWTDSQIRDNVVSFLTANPADVVLLHIGTNGVQADPTQVEEILDNIDSVSEDITVVLARIINRRDGSTTTTEFNDNVEAMALARMDPASAEYTGDKIIIVDMENGAGIVYDQAPSDGDMWDNLHPYETGYAKMANVWLYGDSHGSDGLDDFLPICAPLTPYTPTITSDAVTEAYVDWPYSYDVEADGYPAPTFALTESPSDMTVDTATGLIEWTPTATGDYDVTVEASNSEGTDSQSFTINVAEGPACPVDMISYWKLDETSGSDFDDYYDGNHASCTTGHCPDFAAGLVAGALDFDGSSDYLTVPDDPSLDWANDDSFTVELWAKFTNISGKNKVMVGRDARPGGLHWWVGASSSDGKAAFYLYDSDNVGHSVTGQGSAINDDQWHHLVAIRDASAGTISVYVDGQLVGSASAADYSGDFSATTTLGIGYMAYTGNPDYYYDGLLDEIALYSRALTGDEIEQHYNAGLAGRGYCEIPAGILGDVNGDDTVNSTDALIILSCDVGVDTSQFCPMNCGDVNGDGWINSTDALIILSYDVGMAVPYPVGQPGCPSSVTPCPGCNP